MSPHEIVKHLRRESFRPFRLHMSDGSSCDVRHPEMAIVTRFEVVVALEPISDDVAERAMFCDPLHITRIEPLTESSAAAAAKQNGN